MTYMRWYNPIESEVVMKIPVLALEVMKGQIQANKGFIIRTNGDVVPFNPTVKHGDSKVYDMKKVREACKFDYFEIVTLSDDMMLICDEDAMMKGNSMINPIATQIYQKAYNSNQIGILNDCVICNIKAVN